ncbi:Lrp/AsnC family transcriptional regulator [Microterricola viridarii]|uniref:Transcriptional regulator n=1 Tax=Microterricola viridarii TaxID=412690 RepID=A0A0X8E1G0_9MICO|nr:Lrp/AsnC family transcriptional regulator [Microterricola viridarii]AMB58599.1 transcriptional regulator [Microterricola viridarii]
MTVDRIDRAIIAELSVDARLSVRTIAERVHISRTAAHARVQRLIADGVLTSFAAQVDRKALGLNVTALVIVKIGNVPWPTMAAALAALPFVERVQSVSGDVDFVLTVSAQDNEQLSAVILSQIHSMPGVVSTRSHLVLDERVGTTPGSAPDVWPV